MALDGIEEDWQFVVGVPDPDSEAPQFGTIVTPNNSNNNIYLDFVLNYRDEPSFVAGGLEVKAWKNGVLSAYSTQGTALMQTDNEEISWTQRMSLSGSFINYQIVLGRSTTWGNFGDGSNLAVSFSTSDSSFSNYSPDTSVVRAGVSYGADSVISMTLGQVRYFQDGSLLLTDTNVRQKHQSPWF